MRTEIARTTINGKRIGRPPGPRITKRCQICDAPFKVIPSQAEKRKRCGSPECSRTHLVSISCEVCGESVELRPSLAKVIRTCRSESCRRRLATIRAQRAYGSPTGIDLTPASYQAKSGVRQQRQCVICDAAFVTHPRAERRTCSKQCESKWRSRVRTRLEAGSCLRCGEVFRRRSATSKYCSDQCRMAALQEIPRRRFDGYAGSTKAGYRRVRIWDGNTRRIIMEHRWVMEQVIGRPLRRVEVVHHINGVRDDNRPANLRLYATHSEHMKAEHGCRC